MKLLFTLIFFANTQYAKSQITKYYESISNAERCIIYNKLDSSFHYYEQSFKFKKLPFGKDLNNAALISLKLKKFKELNRNLVELVKLGVSVNVLRSNNLFNSYFIDYKEGKTALKKLELLKPQYDGYYRLQLQNILVKDQYYRKKRNLKNQYVDSIKKADAENISDLLNLIKSKGFPTEQRVGIDSNTFSIPYVDVIFLHQRSGENQQYNFGEMLLENVKNGNLDNRLGYDLYTSNNGLYAFDYMRFLLIKVIDSSKPAARKSNHIVLDSSKWGFMPYKPEQIEKINQIRKLFFLDEYQIHMRKILFNEQYQEYKFGSINSGTSMLYTEKVGFETDKNKLITL